MRTIFHCDINNCFASIEMAMNPALRRFPVAVCGDPALRRGIVLAKSELAKKCGVATGDPLWLARQKCPQIRFVLPHFDVYEQYCRSIRRYYAQYTPLVEPFGLDECWLDLSGYADNAVSAQLELADRMREDIKRLFDVTISVGISFNKVFAKLGSDMKKPDAVTYIAKDRFRDQIWGLPVSALLGVGRSSNEKLHRSGILTIGALALSDRNFIRAMLGKNGLMIWEFANGLDESPVTSQREPRQSLGHGTTLPQDAHCSADLWPVIQKLSQRIAFELQDEGLVARGMQIYVRDCTLMFHQYQMGISFGIEASAVIADYALMMLSQHYTWVLPVRAFGIRLFHLEQKNAPRQRSLFENRQQLQRDLKNSAIDRTIREIQKHFGSSIIERGSCVE